MGFPSGSVAKNLSTSAVDVGLSPRSKRRPREGNGNQLQYSSLGNLMDRGAWPATVHKLTKTEATEHACTWRGGKKGMSGKAGGEMVPEGGLQ